MSRNKMDHPNEDASRNHEGTEAGASLMKMMFVVLFDKTILGAQSEEERLDLCKKFAESPFTDPDSIHRLAEYISYLKEQPGRAEDADTLRRYAFKFYHYFINSKAVARVKMGLSIQCLFKGKAFITVGQALNEGYVEWLTRKLVGETRRSKEKAAHCRPDASAQEEEQDAGTYYFEVRFADALVAMNGEEMMHKAHFGPTEEWQKLSDSVDKKMGDKAFLDLLSQSDHGNWKYVFDKLRPYVSL